MGLTTARRLSAFVDWFVGLAAGSAIVLSTGVARAHGDVDVDRSSSERRKIGGATVAEGAAVHEGGVGGANERGPVTLSLDLVAGWGRVPFAAQNLPTTGMRSITFTYSDATPSEVQSFILAGSIRIAKHVSVGAILPATLASFFPAGSASRSTTSFGNVELEAEYGKRAAEGVSLFGALGIGLPTAQGDEIPRDLVGRDASSVDQGAYDRFSLSRAASWARGSADSALFEPKRLALVPKIGLLYRRRSLGIEPSVTIENLIATASSLRAPYVGEIVPALRVGYAMGRVVDLALRGWANVRFAATRDDRQTAAAIEPEIVFRFGTWTPFAGVIVPLAGPPSERGFFGVDLGVTGSF